MNSAEYPHAHEFERSHETIFPLEEDLLEHRMKVFEASTEDFLKLVTEARGKWGPATSLYANMPFLDLVQWHTGNGEFTPDAEIYYRAGLLYGMDTAKITRLHHDPYAQKLVANNFEIFLNALAYLKSTYEPVAMMGNKLEIQLAREMHFTNSHLLADAAERQYETLSRRIDPTTAANDVIALHAGMVDGAIFVDAYSAYEHGSFPETFT